VDLKAAASFLQQWFGVEGREVGTPERAYIDNYKALFAIIEECRQRLLPCYLSVQPYRARDQPCGIEKLFFEFDCAEDPGRAWKDAAALAEALKRFYNVEPLLVFSGRKGYHVYAFLEKTAMFELNQLDLAKKAYRELQMRILKGLSLPTLDQSVIGDIKRLARCPLSMHQETSSLCAPVTLERKPFIPEDLEAYRTLDPSLLGPVIKELKDREKLQGALSKTKPNLEVKNGRIRPCILAALEKPLEGGNGHLMRLAIARECLAAGCSVDEIVPLFQNQLDFNPNKTRYYVEHAAKNPAKPFTCRKIRELGFCLPNCGGNWVGRLTVMPLPAYFDINKPGLEGVAGSNPAIPNKQKRGASNAPAQPHTQTKRG